MDRADWDVLRDGSAFEAKAARGRDGTGKVPDSFWETYSAFANTNGGVIVLGAEERHDGSLEPVGLPDLGKLEGELWNTLLSKQKVSANLLSQSSITHEEIDGRWVILVSVPKAPRELRPVHLNRSLNHAFQRVHEGDRRMEPDVVRRMVADSIVDRDATVLENYTESDIDPGSLRRYRNVFASARPGHPFTTESDTTFLQQIGAVKHLPGQTNLGLTLAGLLVLGRELSIRDRFAAWHLSYRELPSEPESDVRWIDRVVSDGSWNANLFEFFTRIVPKLHQGLKVPFTLRDGQQRIDDTPAHKALREALVNTLVHADYEGRSGIRVLRDPGGFEFVNPGLLLVTPDQVWKGGVSVSRNPVVQRLFGLLQFGEREGSGGPAILRAWSEQHWQPPELLQNVETSELHLRMRLASLLPKNSVRVLRSVLGTAFDAQDRLGRIALVTSHAENGAAHSRITTLSSAHPRDVTVKLQELVRKGLLIGSGPPRTRVYSVRTTNLSEESTHPHKDSQGSEENSDTMIGTSIRTSIGTSIGTRNTTPHEESPPPRTDSPDSVASSDARIGTSTGRSTGTSTGTSQADARDQPRITAAEQVSILLAYCSTWRTISGIASHLGLKEDTVRKRYLPRLLEEDRILRRFPDQPKNPNQAYRATRSQPKPGACGSQPTTPRTQPRHRKKNDPSEKPVAPDSKINLNST